MQRKWQVILPAIFSPFLLIVYFWLSTQKSVSYIKENICLKPTIYRFYDAQGREFHTRAAESVQCTAITPEETDKFIGLLNQTISKRPAISQVRIIRALTETNAQFMHSRLFRNDWHIIALMRKKLILRSIANETLAFHWRYYLSNVAVSGSHFGLRAFTEIIMKKNIHEIASAELEQFLAFVRFKPFGHMPLDAATRLRLEIAFHEHGRLKSLQEYFQGREFLDWINIFLKRKNLKFTSGEDIHIHTTYRPDIQKQAQELLIAEFKNWDSQTEKRRTLLSAMPPVEAAVLVADPKTGGVLAMIGGMQYGPGSSNTVFSTRRQASSTVKPFIYGYALENLNYHSASKFKDEKISITDDHGKQWEPKNYYKYFQGDMTLKTALAKSINTVPVQIGESIGRIRLAKFFRDLFLHTESDSERRIQPVPSQALGSFDLSVYEMSRGYQMLANQGVQREFFGIAKIIDETNTVVYQHMKDTHLRTRTFFSAETTSIVTDILQAVVLQGTAADFNKQDSGIQYAAKTGSSRTDSWFAGYSPEIMMTVWAGFEEPEAGRIFNLPAFSVVPYWFKVMNKVNTPGTRFSVPSTLEQKEFCQNTGCTGDKTCLKLQGLFRKGTLLPACNGRK